MTGDAGGPGGGGGGHNIVQPAQLLIGHWAAACMARRCRAVDRAELTARRVGPTRWSVGPAGSCNAAFTFDFELAVLWSIRLNSL